MLKFGITDLIQIKNKKQLKTFLNKDKKISITLYENIKSFPEADELAEHTLFLFSDERGAYKRTYQKRFEVFDTQVLDLLKEVFVNSDSLYFHDVGVSDGRTALDFFEKLSQEFSQIHYFASDYNPSVYILEKGRTKVTISHTGKILEIVFPPFVFNKIKSDNFFYYPLNHLVCFFIELFPVRSIMKQYNQGRLKPTELLLFAPIVLQKVKKDDRFMVGQHDLLKSFGKTVHIIRAMNVLNLSYFSTEEFQRVIENLYKGLKEGGILITGSNQEAGSLVHAGLYQKKGNRFKKLFQSGESSPVEFLILSYTA